MSRSSRHAQDIKLAKQRRALALERPELRFSTEGRVSAASPTSFPLKTEDPETARLIEEALAKRAKP